MSDCRHGMSVTVCDGCMRIAELEELVDMQGDTIDGLVMMSRKDGKRIAELEEELRREKEARLALAQRLQP